MTTQTPFLAGDPLAYTIATIKNCRRRFYPFLWWYMDRRDLMAHSRSLAWLILNEDKPQTKRDLWNAVQRRMYREAKNDGWHRNRWSGMRYARPMILAGDINPDFALIQSSSLKEASYAV